MNEQPALAARSTVTTPRFSDSSVPDVFALLEEHVPFTRRIVRADDHLFQAGSPFCNLHIVHSGLFKLVTLTDDGREQVSAFHFKGDWLGFDGIATSRHGCDAIAMDIGEVWTIRYDTLMQACMRHPELLAAVHQAMSRQITRGRDTLMSVCTLPADARVAEFLRYWVESLSQRGLRTDQITLRLTRAEIGNYLGMKLETVSRALSRLAREKLIAFTEAGRRDLSIPNPRGLDDFIQGCLAPSSAALH
jgi:CRP/FNR family transcriptional regulator